MLDEQIVDRLKRLRVEIDAAVLLLESCGYIVLARHEEPPVKEGVYLKYSKIHKDFGLCWHPLHMLKSEIAFGPLPQLEGKQ